MPTNSTPTNSAIVAAYRERTPESAKLAAQAQALLPSGIAHDARICDPYGIYVARAAGPRKWDVDGNEYVDYFGGHGALLLGHNHPDVLKATQEALSLGTHFGANHPREIEWAAEGDSSNHSELVVFGDGPLRSWVERSARGVSRVHIAGFVADRRFIAGALASADGLIHGSAAETYGFVVAEALSSGTPVIVPDRGGAFDFATPACSEVYRPGDARDCANAIARLLRRDTTALRQASLAQARAHVGSQEDHFEQLFALYARLLQG